MIMDFPDAKTPAGPTALLVVEDTASDFALLDRAFKKAGIKNQIVQISNGDEALAYLLGEGRYADRNRYPLPMLVLLDLKLPKLSGFEVLAFIRSQPGLRRLPVVILTSSSHEADIDHAYDLGANSYLVKSNDPAEVDAMIQRLEEYWMRLNQRPNVHWIREQIAG